MFGRKGVKRVESIETSEPALDESEGLSLEELGSAYAMAIEQAASEVPLPDGSVDSTSRAEGNSTPDRPTEGMQEEFLEAPEATETDGVPVTPESILEAMLFLGSSSNQPLGIDKLIELFRGVSAAELEQSVDALNTLYRENNRAMTIARQAGGYLMQLVPEMNLVRDRFYGKIKETQLTQAAIDCLSLVAYHPGSTKEEIEKQWNQSAASMLSTLVRKGLLRIERRPSQSGRGDPSQYYYTTDRFLEIIGLESLEDLPLSEDI